MREHAALVAVLIAAALLAGCASPPPTPTVDASEPALKLPPARVETSTTVWVNDSAHWEIACGSPPIICGGSLRNGNTSIAWCSPDAPCEMVLKTATATWASQSIQTLRFALSSDDEILIENTGESPLALEPRDFAIVDGKFYKIHLDPPNLWVKLEESVRIDLGFEWTPPATT